MRSTSRTTVLVASILLASCVAFRQYDGIEETASKYSMQDPAHVPIIVAALVTGDTAAVGSVRPSKVYQQIQLTKARIRIENVLQGDVQPGETDLFSFTYQTPGSARPLHLKAGERDLFFLLRDGNKLRTICEGVRNCCAQTVMTGAHPEFKRDASKPINQEISDFLLSRGSGVDDAQMMAAIEKQGVIFGNDAMLNTLAAIAKNETPAAREAACEQLLGTKYACAEDAAGPSVVIQNLTHPYLSDKFSLGDRIQTNVTGPKNQPVYLSWAEGGISGITKVGVTDGHGHFAFTEQRLSSRATRTELWSVGSAEASPSISYVPARSGPLGEVIAIPVGNLRDRDGMAISVISTFRGTVTTYAVIQLSYPTSLYYDVRAESTIYQEGQPIKAATVDGWARASQLLQAPTIDMQDYLFQTSEYAVAFFGGSEFYNPRQFADGSCFGIKSDCRIVPLGGATRVTKAAILLGATGADQTAIPRDPGWMMSGLGADDKAEAVKSALDVVLARREGVDDNDMVAVIELVAAEPSYRGDALVSKLRELAKHETPKVREAACSGLKTLKQTCPARRADAAPAPPELPRPAAKRPEINPSPLLGAALPKYLVYADFLSMIHLLDAKPGWTWPFANGKPQPLELKKMRDEAQSLAESLAGLDRKAQVVADQFRLGKDPTKPMPTVLYQLEAQRTAVMVNHMISFQASFGSYDGFLAYWFTTHQGLGIRAHRTGS